MTISKHELEIIRKTQTGNLFIDGYTYPIKWLKRIAYDAKVLAFACDKDIYDDAKNTEIEAESPLSFCRNFDKNIETTVDIIKFLTNPPKLEEKYEVIVLLDLHNLISPYYRMLIWIMKSNPKAKLCIIGDRNQVVDHYKGASEKFFDHYDKLFANNFSWERVNTEENPFQNKVIEKYNFEEFLTKLPDIAKYPKHVLMCKSNIYRINMFISMINSLIEKNVPVYITQNDDTMFSTALLQNKLVFCNFQQAVGIKRKITVIFINEGNGFAPAIKNLEYAAMLTAKEKIILVTYKYDYTIDNNFSVGDLLSFAHPDAIYQASQFLNYREIKPNEAYLQSPKNIPVKFGQTQQEQDFTIATNKKLINIKEKVGDIIGILVPMYYEYVKTGRFYYLEKLRQQTIDCIPKSFQKLLNSDIEITIENMIKLYLIHYTWSNGYKHKINQIDCYDWILQEDLDLAVKRMEEVIGNKILPEQEFSCQIANHKIYGRADFINNNLVLETKMAKGLFDEDKLQLACLAYIIEVNKNQKKKKKKNKKNRPNTYRLFNIKSNELIELDMPFNNLEKIVNILLASKIKYPEPIF
jgi:hypothetical protein